MWYLKYELERMMLICENTNALLVKQYWVSDILTHFWKSCQILMIYSWGYHTNTFNAIAICIINYLLFWFDLKEEKLRKLGEFQTVREKAESILGCHKHIPAWETNFHSLVHHSVVTLPCRLPWSTQTRGYLCNGIFNDLFSELTLSVIYSQG